MMKFAQILPNLKIASTMSTQLCWSHFVEIMPLKEEIQREFYLTIAAASILAKTYRDEYMDNLAKEYPQYDWQNNKGYPTKKHRQAIKENGITPHHRKTFNLYGELSLFE